MSRIGRMKIKIPAGIAVTFSGSKMLIKGPKGELTHNLRPEIGVKNENGELEFFVKEETKESNALWGMTRAIIANMVSGVEKGFEKKLDLVGVGYRVAAKGTGISLSLGYSHPIEYDAPKGITLKVEENKSIVVSGVDKQLVGQTAAKIRAFRKPESYKGKGVKYSDEVVKTKPGKSGKV